MNLTEDLWGILTESCSGEFGQKIGRFRTSQILRGRTSFEGIAREAGDSWGAERGFLGDSPSADSGIRGFPTEEGLGGGNLRGQRRVSGGILRAEREFFEEFPHYQQEGGFLGITSGEGWIPGLLHSNEGRFQSSPQADGFKEISSSGRWCLGYSPGTEVGFWGILRAEGSKYQGNLRGKKGVLGRGESWGQKVVSGIHHQWKVVSGIPPDREWFPGESWGQKEAFLVESWGAERFLVKSEGKKGSWGISEGRRSIHRVLHSRGGFWWNLRAEGFPEFWGQKGDFEVRSWGQEVLLESWGQMGVSRGNPEGWMGFWILESWGHNVFSGESWGQNVVSGDPVGRRGFWDGILKAECGFHEILWAEGVMVESWEQSVVPWESWGVVWGFQGSPESTSGFLWWILKGQKRGSGVEFWGRMGFWWTSEGWRVSQEGTTTGGRRGFCWRSWGHKGVSFWDNHEGQKGVSGESWGEKRVFSRGILRARDFLCDPEGRRRFWGNPEGRREFLGVPLRAEGVSREFWGKKVVW